MGLYMSMLYFLRAVDIFKNLVRFAEAKRNIALGRVIDTKDIAVFFEVKLVPVEAGFRSSALTVQNRRPWFHRLRRIENRRQWLIVDFDQLQRLFSDVFLPRRYRSDDVADIAHPIECDHRLIFPHWRSEERRVGKECRARWSPHHYKKTHDASTRYAGGPLRLSSGHRRGAAFTRT